MSRLCHDGPVEKWACKSNERDRLAARAERPGGFGTCVPGTPSDQHPTPLLSPGRTGTPPLGPRSHKHAASQPHRNTLKIFKLATISQGAGGISAAETSNRTPLASRREDPPAAPASPQQASAPSGLSCNYHRPEPERLTRKTLAGLGSDPPLQDHARTQLQGPRDPGNRLILPQVKPKPQDNAAPRPPLHQRGT